MSSKNKNSIKDIFYLVITRLLGSLIIATCIYIMTLGDGLDNEDSSPVFLSNNHKTSDMNLVDKKTIKLVDDNQVDNGKDNTQIKQLSDDSGNDGQWKTFEVTMYTANVESTGKTPEHPQYGITASGNKVKPNFTIACPPNMEFGTEVYIKKLDNTYVCDDRGSAITAGHLDVYVKSLERALKFGRQQLKVKILN